MAYPSILVLSGRFPAQIVGTAFFMHSHNMYMIKWRFLLAKKKFVAPENLREGWAFSRQLNGVIWKAHNKEIFHSVMS
jgi:hypothetical protein